MKWIAWNLLVLLSLPVLWLAAILPARKRSLLVWGSVPLISNKHWSAAMRAQGLDSRTLMQGHYKISKHSDFDAYFDELAPRWLPHLARRGLGTLFALVLVLRRARTLHISFDGFALGASVFWRIEASLLRLAGVKVVVIPYGADAYQYSQVIDPSLRYGLLASYPLQARKEPAIRRRVEHWSTTADIVIAGLMIDGMGRWDVTTPSPFCIDTDGWMPVSDYSRRDGVKEAVRIIHTPNHRGFKGTEYLIDAVDRLKQEGLKIELVLLEGVPNEQVRETMRTADILAEQFIATGYAFSGIEGMASGLPVMANLEHEAYTRLFRRYAFLNECPILSTSPETLRDHLRLLMRNPQLREELGRAGRAYVEKYHSFAAAQYMFGAVHERLDGRDVDLINLFHPLKSHYVKRSPVNHALIENRLPADSSYRQC